MWHSRGTNISDLTRKVLFLGYSYRWLRGLDYNVIPDEILEKCDPIRRQMLGDGVDVKGWWQPTEASKGWPLSKSKSAEEWHAPEPGKECPLEAEEEREGYPEKRSSWQNGSAFHVQSFLA